MLQARRLFFFFFFREILFSYSILKERVKLRKPLHKQICFQQPLRAAHSQTTNRAFRLLSLPCSFPSETGRVSLLLDSIWCKDRARLYIPAEQIYKFLSFSNVFPGWNCRTLLKTLKLLEYDKFEFCSPFWGPSWQAFFALKHCLFFHVFIEIVYWTLLHSCPLIH